MTNFPAVKAEKDWAAERSPLPRGTRWLMPYVAKRPRAQVTEWGAAYGEHIDVCPAGGKYHGFESSPALVTRAESLHLPISWADPAIPLPLEAASQDLFLAIDYLEYLRMDQLYMVLAEARRTLKPGGICLLRSLSFAPGAFGGHAGKWWNRVHASRPAWVKGRRPLELTHYISPEDWRTLADVREPALLISSQYLVLERL